MINVLYTVNGLRINGMTTVIMQYISGLDKKKYRFWIFTDEVAPQVLVQLKEYYVTIISSQNRRKNQIAYYRELISVLKDNQIDILHAHGNSATLAVEMWAAKSCGVSVRIAHSHNTTCEHKIFDKVLRPFFYCSYTHGIGCGIEAGKWLFKEKQHEVIKNGIKLENFKFNKERRDTIRNQLNIEDKYVIGHIGRFTDQKNHLFILDIFSQFKEQKENAVLLLVGDGPKKEQVLKKIEELNLNENVILYGTTSDVSSLYSAMDVFLFPSKFEGVPLTLIEAQANGLPCLISDKISDEVLLTEMISVVQLDDKDEWIKKLKKIQRNRLEDSKASIIKLTESGFDYKNVIRCIDMLYHHSVGES